MKQVNINKAKYLGGLPGDKGGYAGRFMVTDEGISVGQFKAPGKGGPVKWSEMSTISFDSDSAAKSRVGKALAFGVLAFAAKNSQKTAQITVWLENGLVTLYEIEGKSGPAVRGQVQPFLSEHGIPCVDDEVQVTQSGDPASMADEIAKLVDLRDSGAITEDEFTAYKAKLLES